MIDGFANLVNNLIEKRMESIITSEEYTIYIENIYQDVEQQLFGNLDGFDEETKNNLMEDLKNIIFQQVFYQSKLTYHTAFQDALSFFVDTLLLSKR